MNNKSFDELMSGYVNNQLNKEELDRFLQLLQQEDHQGNLQRTIEQLLVNRSVTGLSDQERSSVIFQKIMDAAAKEDGAREDEPRDDGVIHLKKRNRLFTFMRIAIAASVIGLLSLGAYFWINKNTKQEIAKTGENKKLYRNDVLPGGDKAVLTLADGSTIVLDDVQNGALAQQGSTKVIKLGGKLSYDAGRNGAAAIAYNTISTPRGGQYQVKLPDGSQVWLNAASSLHFPTAFTGKERRIEITGEAYFEVAKNKAMPFIVSVSGAEVQVLGTHFNVMAYNDEPAVKTTLIEGAVKFVKENNTSLLKPGEQSQLTKEGQIKVLNNIDVMQVMAWKNGMFHFDYADIETVMRQLSRWYDVEVEYKNRNIRDQFVMELPRSSKLSDVLKILELTGNINFEIEGKKIIVMP
jgi:ferric-dicitrate binding protein FerR (iron transport regulator)